MCGCRLIDTCACVHMCVHIHIFSVYTHVHKYQERGKMRGDTSTKPVSVTCQGAWLAFLTPPSRISPASFALRQNLGLLGSFISNEITQTFIPKGLNHHSRYQMM